MPEDGSKRAWKGTGMSTQFHPFHSITFLKDPGHFEEFRPRKPANLHLIFDKSDKTPAGAGIDIVQPGGIEVEAEVDPGTTQETQSPGSAPRILTSPVNMRRAAIIQLSCRIALSPGDHHSSRETGFIGSAVASGRHKTDLHRADGLGAVWYGEGCTCMRIFSQFKLGVPSDHGHFALAVHPLCGNSSTFPGLCKATRIVMPSGISFSVSICA
jgi:hypothetical protein